MLFQCRKHVCHIMRFMHLEVSPGGCFSWLSTLCFPVFFQWHQCMQDLLILHASLCTQRCACPLPRYAQTVLRSALCFTDYGILFKMAPMKWFFFPGKWRTVHLFNLYLRGIHQTKVGRDPFLSNLFSSSTWAGLTAKLLLKDGAVPMLLCHIEEWEAQAISNILSVS